jgi:hypothetical protein
MAILLVYSLKDCGAFVCAKNYCILKDRHVSANTSQISFVMLFWSGTNNIEFPCGPQV